jgi:hypothetical protein
MFHQDISELKLMKIESYYWQAQKPNSYREVDGNRAGFSWWGLVGTCWKKLLGAIERLGERG